MVPGPWSLLTYAERKLLSDLARQRLSFETLEELGRDRGFSGSGGLDCPGGFGEGVPSWVSADTALIDPFTVHGCRKATVRFGLLAWRAV